MRLRCDATPPHRTPRVVFCPETSPPPHVYTATGLQLAAFELSVTPLYPRPHVDELHACWVRRVLLLGRTLVFGLSASVVGVLVGVGRRAPRGRCQK
eukprot:1356313-Prymnesium_polylepis.3